MKAIIQIDVPDYQLGQEVSIYFKDTMMIKGIVQESKTIRGLHLSQQFKDWLFIQEPKESDHKCHTCKHYMSGEYDGSCDSYICKGYSDWESEDEE